MDGKCYRILNAVALSVSQLWLTLLLATSQPRHRICEEYSASQTYTLLLLAFASKAIMDSGTCKDMVILQVQGQAIEKAVEDYAQKQCGELCSRIMATLPRELRDLIYPYAWTIKNIFVGGFPGWLISGFEHCSGPEQRIFECQEDRYCRPDVVGPEIWPELIESWYRTRLFTLGSNTLAHEFLEQDRWSLGFSPKALIKDIYNPKSRFALHISCDWETSSYAHRMWILRQQLQTIIPILSKMKELGWKVNLSIIPNTLSPPSEQQRLTFVYETADSTPEQWLSYIEGLICAKRLGVDDWGY
ncbi:hypothetical protein BDV96DRAFT_607978 [Lophiotrema nucula]|uniref:Uncharacterized protein n=1 Tax=Lophiotrema nucula TaxID=690887 RepID=A0A6A5YEP7_9PLEO|nr:hypothetical protein BDV96DRAFT_607978 [Lophiotrema nucula]